MRWNDKLRTGPSIFSLFIAAFFLGLSSLAFLVAAKQPLPLPLLLIFSVFFVIGLGLVAVPLWQRLSTVKGTSSLAEVLMADLELKKVLVGAGTGRIWVVPDRRNRCVRITPSRRPMNAESLGPVSIPSVGRKAFPSRDAFRLYDMIAGHVRQAIAEKQQSSNQ